jgi:hypothetical protein
VALEEGKCMAEKMTAEEYRQYTRSEMIRIAQDILSGKSEMVSGCRRLLELVPFENKDLYTPISAFVSETDIFPLGEARAGYENSYLASLDARREKYSEQSKPWIFDACNAIIEYASSNV